MRFKLSCGRVVLLAAMLVFCGWLALADPPARVESAYWNGRLVSFIPAPPERGERSFSVGPWPLGPKVSDPKPRDPRLNLYVVCPGRQHHAEGWDQYDHTEIINALPSHAGPVEWDVYWAVVLDPRLHADFHNERDLLMARQARFLPGDLYEFDDIPSSFFLKTFLGIASLEELRPFRQRHSLPRVLILPAGFAIRAAAEPALASVKTPR